MAFSDEQRIEELKKDNAKLGKEILRLREWIDDLQSGMYINCVYCGHRYGPEGEYPASMAEVLKEHVEQCPAHPMSALKVELENQVRAATQLKIQLMSVIEKYAPPAAQAIRVLGLDEALKAMGFK